MDNAQRDDENGQSETLRRAAAGDEEALRLLFAAHRDRLKRMVHPELPAQSDRESSWALI
jgi:hypothetical protein